MLQLETSVVNELIALFGEVTQSRKIELDLANDTQAEEAHASAELIEAQEATTAKFDAFKLAVMQKLQAGDVPVVQEGDASRAEGDAVIIPASVSCECKAPPPGGDG